MADRHNTRAEWADVPVSFRSAVDRQIGSPIVGAINIAGGFSPGPAAVCSLADGRSVFVKACGPELNTFTPAMHRREATILGQLPSEFPVPRLLGVVDDDDWVALIIEAVDGTMPRAPLSAAEVTAVLDVVDHLAEIGNPSPIADLAHVGPSGRDHVAVYSWQRLSNDGLVDRLDPWTTRHLADLTELESGWLEAVAGDTLLHGDLRTDNIIIGASSTYVVDWPAAGVGAPWVDLVGLLPALHLDGGPVPDEIFTTRPLGHSADPGAVDSYLSALAGYFTRQSLLPPPPGIATVRSFQAAQGAVCRAWLGDRLGWP
ncbi:MAG: phosphotransferase [Ilumatobacteraceae bacterium]